jgi:large conductance mechanosensitive channel
MGFVKEFKEFALKGNVMDLAIGVIIGAAFGRIVDSVVNDLFMPVIGVFFNSDFSNLYLPLSSEVPSGLTLEEARAAGPVLAWGNFISVLINFLLIAMVIFLLIKGINKMRRKKDAATETEKAPEHSLQEKLLMEIRDSLTKR